MVDIYLGPQLLSGSTDSLQQKVEARSCTRVSILPFHPNLIGSSLFATLWLLKMGITHYVLLIQVSRSVFGLSSTWDSYVLYTIF